MTRSVPGDVHKGTGTLTPHPYIMVLTLVQLWCPWGCDRIWCFTRERRLDPKCLRLLRCCGQASAVHKSSQTYRQSIFVRSLQEWSLLPVVRDSASTLKSRIGTVEVSGSLCNEQIFPNAQILGGLRLLLALLPRCEKRWEVRCVSGRSGEKSFTNLGRWSVKACNAKSYIEHCGCCPKVIPLWNCMEVLAQAKAHFLFQDSKLGSTDPLSGWARCLWNQKSAVMPRPTWKAVTLRPSKALLMLLLPRLKVLAWSRLKHKRLRWTSSWGAHSLMWMINACSSSTEDCGESCQTAFWQAAGMYQKSMSQESSVMNRLRRKRPIPSRKKIWKVRTQIQLMWEKTQNAPPWCCEICQTTTHVRCFWLCSMKKVSKVCMTLYIFHVIFGGMPIWAMPLWIWWMLPLSIVLGRSSMASQPGRCPLQKFVKLDGVVHTKAFRLMWTGIAIALWCTRVFQTATNPWSSKMAFARPFLDPPRRSKSQASLSDENDEMWKCFERPETVSSSFFKSMYSRLFIETCRSLSCHRGIGEYSVCTGDAKYLTVAAVMKMAASARCTAELAWVAFSERPRNMEKAWKGQGLLSYAWDQHQVTWTCLMQAEILADEDCRKLRLEDFGWIQ